MDRSCLSKATCSVQHEPIFIQYSPVGGATQQRSWLESAREIRVGIGISIVITIAIINFVAIIGINMQVMTEIAGETLEQMAAAPKSKAAPARAVAPTQEDEAADAEAEDLQARLNAIRS